MAGGRDKTPDKVLEKDERAEGARALGEQERTDNEHEVDANEKLHFQSIASAMHRAVGDKPSLELHNDMSIEEQRAIELLFEAASGTEIQSGDYLFADQRSALLNQALRTLQPVLALGLAPDFVEGRAAYTTLASEVSSLRTVLKKAAIGQLPINVKRKPSTARGDGEDEDEDDDKPGDEPDEPGDADDDVGADAAPNTADTGPDPANAHDDGAEQPGGSAHSSTTDEAT